MLPFLLLMSPLIALCLLILWVIFGIGDKILKVMLWPYKVLAGFVGLVLAGGRR